MRRPLRAAAAATVAVLFFAACSPQGGHPDGTDGPLDSDLDGGGVSIAVPDHADWPWQGTFGSLMICADEEVTLLWVEPHYRAGRPVTATFTVRSVPERARRTGRQGPWSPVGSSTTPLERLLGQELRSTQVRPLGGAVVDEPCVPNSKADDPYTEILTTLAVDEAGVWIDRLDVHYRAGGRQHVLRVGWSYVGCGRAITDPDVCWVD
ncbi:hypothetical protein SAMN05421671_5317 [Pimelobacter simplex]|nr:hypothetical protein SAMN05421671_5317 [Pimelobacter simplex]